MQNHTFVMPLPVVGIMAEIETELHEIRRNIPFKTKEFTAIKSHADAKGVKFATFVRRAALREIAAAPVFGAKGVPLVGFIHAGNPEECQEESSREIFCSEHPNGDSYGYLEVCGNCMDKQVPEGALALFRNQGWDFGQTVAVLVDCELVLRVLEYDPKFKCNRLDPDSTDESHKSILIREEDPKSDKHIWMRPEQVQFRGVFTHNYIMRGGKK